MLSVENLTALGENKLHSDKRDVFSGKRIGTQKGIGANAMVVIMLFYVLPMLHEMTILQFS